MCVCMRVHVRVHVCVCVCVCVCVHACVHMRVCVMTFGTAYLCVGSGVEPDMKKSAEIFTELALRGHPYAQVHKWVES